VPISSSLTVPLSMLRAESFIARLASDAGPCGRHE
jgi:hypothetical protein